MDLFYQRSYPFLSLILWSCGVNCCLQCRNFLCTVLDLIVLTGNFYKAFHLVWYQYGNFLIHRSSHIWSHARSRILSAFSHKTVLQELLLTMHFPQPSCPAYQSFVCLQSKFSSISSDPYHDRFPWHPWRILVPRSVLIYSILNILRPLYAISHLSYLTDRQAHLPLQNHHIFRLISSVIHILHPELLLDTLCYPFSVLSTHQKWIFPVSLRFLVQTHYLVVLPQFLFLRYPMYVLIDSDHLLWYLPVQISRYPRLPDLA